MRSPEQALYDYVGTWSVNAGYDTYDHQPMESENASYPFVRIGDVNTVLTPNKTSLGATINLTINVWGSEEQRLVVDEITNRFLLLASQTLIADGYRFKGIMRGSSSQILKDNSLPNTVLNHGIVQLQFKLI